MPKYIIEDPELLKQWDYKKNQELGIAPDWITLGSNVDVWWKCELGHSYHLSTYKRAYLKQGCYYCSNRRLLVGFNDLKTRYPQVAEEWDYDANPDNPEDYTFVSTHVAKWVCKECGNKWNSKIRDKVSAKWNGCGKCALRKRGVIKHNQALERGCISDPVLLAEWDYSKNEKGPDEYTPNSNERVFWVCSKCGYGYDSTVANRTKVKSACPACSNRVVVPGYNDLKTTHPQIAAEWHPTLNGELKPEMFTYGRGDKVWWLCPEGHTYQATILHRCVGTGTNCPICNSGRQTSFAEQAVFYYVRKVFPDAINRYTDIFDNGMELDIYIPSIKLGIEYDGEAWHKKELADREKRKWEICQQHSIRLKRLKEKVDRDSSSNADSTLGIDGRMYEHDKLEQVIRVLLDEIDPDSNMWTRKNPFHFHSDVDINIKRDEMEIRKYMTKLNGKSLLDKYPDLAKEWHPTLNGDLTPDKIKPKSEIKVWWKCPTCGYEYKATPSHRTEGTGCIKCGFKKSATSRAKAVQMIDTKTGNVIKEYESISAAGRELHIRASNIGEVCKGRRNKAGGYCWKYKD